MLVYPCSKVCAPYSYQYIADTFLPCLQIYKCVSYLHFSDGKSNLCWNANICNYISLLFHKCLFLGQIKSVF